MIVTHDGAQHAAPRMQSRSELLTELADAVNELTRPRQTTTFVEHSVTRTVTTRSGKQRAKRTRERRRHTVTLPSLVTELGNAAVPGAAGTSGAPAGGFESRPAAELDPVSTLREITDEASFWIRVFRIEPSSLKEALSALVSAPHDDEQLALIARQAKRWVHRARVATGLEPPPITIQDPCPYCMRRNTLVITGDLASARCYRCGTRWSPDTIGLLADMLRANATQETAAAVPCWMPDCVRVGVHEEHEDGRGHIWGNLCAVPDHRPLDGGV